MYIQADGHSTHARPQQLVIAETDRLGCFVGEPRPIESRGPLPLKRDDGADPVAGIRSDLGHLASETASGRADLEAVSYYLTRREDLTDQAYALYGQPGLEAVRSALSSEDQFAAIERLRQAAGDPSLLAGLDPIQAAKLRALLRDPARFVPCRSLAPPRH